MLIRQLGTTPIKEQVLHDLDLPRLLCRLDASMTEKTALGFLGRYICSDAGELAERFLLFRELSEKASAEELEELSVRLASLPEERLKFTNAGDKLHQVLYTRRRYAGTVWCLEKLAALCGRGFSSRRMQELGLFTEKLRNEPSYKAAVKAVSASEELLTVPKSVSVGINVRADARPLEMGILTEAAEEGTTESLLKTEDMSRPINSLFPEMPYHRDQFGTHFEEYIGRQLEKQWKNKLNKAVDLFKKLPEPPEDELAALSDDFHFLAEGLFFKAFFEKRGVPVTVPVFSDDPAVCVQAEGLVYPELAAKADHVEPNPVHLKKGNAVIVTGANHSGKTSYLKTLAQGLFLAQMGYYVPASSFSFCPVRQVFTLFSAGEDEEMQSSRMGVEIRIIADFLKQAQEHDLVLINEPLTSTNPVEAISLCSDIIRQFLKKNVTSLTVTHLYDV